MRRWIIWGFVVVVAVIVVWRVAAFLGREANEVEETTPVVLAARAKVLLFEEGLVFYGTLEPRDQVMVFPDAPGKVIRFAVREGATVGKGTTIATVDRDVTGLDFKPLVVTSPAYGVVAGLLVDPGMQVGPGTAVATIYRTKDLILPIEVGEKDLAKVEEGQAVALTVATFPGKVFEGKVSKIFPTLDPRSHTVRAEIKINDPKGELRAGMFGRTEISITRREGVLFVPHEAINREGEEVFVWALDDGELTRRPVGVGASHGGAVEVTSGLTEGEMVVIRGAAGLPEGTGVKVEERAWAE